MSSPFMRPPGAGEYFVVGGTLRRDAPSYVPRRADDDLFEALTAGAFCYVLTSRQMGKSSLMVRTAARLRDAGDTPVVIDLTEIGQNLTVEQWYRGLLGATGEALGLEDELDDFRRAHAELGAMHRWMRAMREVVLPRTSGRLVVFIDEIDAVRSLPFSTDEFFAGIRETFNRRAVHPQLERLTFCLLGVATPADLIRDTRTTPFNIGRRVELADFSPREAAALARGLGRPVDQARALVDRVFYWTGGHPYLTQRLCQTVAATPDVTTPGGVDRLCDELFLSRVARERDDNLLFARDRLLRSDGDTAALLELYRRVLAGGRVPDDETDARIGVLKLSGVVRVESGALRRRNRIYERVFDREWVTENMPGAEVRRQRAAFKKGLVRAAAVSLVVLAAMAYLVVTARTQRNRAEEQRALVEQEQSTNRRLIYVANMNVAYQALAQNDFRRAAAVLLEEHSTAGQADERDFEYYRLWRVFHSARSTFAAAGSPVYDAVASPDGKYLATARGPGAIQLWDAATNREVFRLQEKTEQVYTLAFSPDSKTLAAAGPDRPLRFIDVPSGRVTATATGPGGATAVSVAFSPDGSTVAAGQTTGGVVLLDRASLRDLQRFDGGGVAGTVAFSADGSRLAVGALNAESTLFDVASGRKIAAFAPQSQGIRSIALSSDGRLLATLEPGGQIVLRDGVTGAETGRIPTLHPGTIAIQFSPDGARLAVVGSGVAEVWDVQTLAREATYPEISVAVFAAAFSRDGATLTTGAADGTLQVHSVGDPGAEGLTLRGHEAEVYSVAYSPDGRLLATASFDGTVGLWDMGGKRLASLAAHTGNVRSVAFSPDGTMLVSGGDDGTVRLWDVAARRQSGVLVGHTNNVFSVCFSPDGATVASASFDGTVKLWNVAGQVLRRTLQGPGGSIECVAISPDGRTVAAGGEGTVVMLWDVETGRETGRLEGHTDWVNALAYSPDGKYLASVGSYNDGTVRVWDTASGSLHFDLKGFSKASVLLRIGVVAGRANAVRFSPKGTILALGVADGSVKLYDMVTGQEAGTMTTGHQQQVNSIAFAPDGGSLATASDDRTVKVWPAATEAEVQGQPARE